LCLLQKLHAALPIDPIVGVGHEEGDEGSEPALSQHVFPGAVEIIANAPSRGTSVLVHGSPFLLSPVDIGPEERHAVIIPASARMTNPA
jgi:hypothetical protein